MKAIGQHLQKTFLQHSNNTSGALAHLSPRQQTEREKFMNSFSTVEKLYSFFCPAMWSYALKHVDECLTYPCIYLAQVDEAYNTPGAANNIVRGHLIGIYSLSTAREQYNERSANMAADLFIAKYGQLCTLYDTMLYFSNYLMEYKSTYAQFDVQDIISQFSRKYLPWKRSRMQPEEEAEHTRGIPLEEMVYLWVAGGRTDEDFRENSGLYQLGMITDKMIKDARDEFRRREEDGVF